MIVANDAGRAPSRLRTCFHIVDCKHVYMLAEPLSAKNFDMLEGNPVSGTLAEVRYPRLKAAAEAVIQALVDAAVGDEEGEG